MKKILFLGTVFILAFSASVFGQAKKTKVPRALPEVGDEVLVSQRQKKKLKPKTSSRKKTTKRSTKPFFDEADALFGKRRKTKSKYANQEVSYRKKLKLRKKKSVTHDPEFENWANRKKGKIKK